MTRPELTITEVLIDADPNLMAHEANNVSRKIIEALENAGFALVRTLPSQGVLISMARMSKQEFLGPGLTPERRKAYLHLMRRLHDEVTGLGHYSSGSERDLAAALKRADDEYNAKEAQNVQ